MPTQDAGEDRVTAALGVGGGRWKRRARGLRSSCIEQGKRRESSLTQDLCFCIFSWVMECLRLVCAATVRDLRNKKVRVFFLVAMYSFCSKIFLSRCKGAARSFCVESKSSDVASPTAPLKHHFGSFLFRPQPHDVRRPRRASFWDAEQLPGLPGTGLAPAAPRYLLWLVRV